MEDKKKIFLEVDRDLRRIASDVSIYLPLCPYGTKCYRKNLQHFQEYRHEQTATHSDSVTNSEEATNSQQSKKTPKKCLLPFTKNNSITSYFKPRTSLENNLECDKLKLEKKEKVCFEMNKKPQCSIEPDNDHESKRIGKDKCDIETIGTKRKFKESNGDDVRKLIKSKETSSTDLEGFNDLNKLMPNLDKILAESDNFKNAAPLDIPSSSSEPSKTFKQEIQPKVLSPNELKELVQRIFLVEMPESFFLFWDFCKEISPKNPRNALIDTLGFKLVGPFDVLSGQIGESNINEDHDSILTHWRFFYDPPELQTFAVIDPDTSISFEFSLCYHLGYFRDIPQEDSPVVVSNDSEKSCQINGLADNIFSAFWRELSKRKSKCKDIRKLKLFENKLKSFADKHNIELDADSKLKQRKKKVNAPTFHKFGIVVDVVDDVGYRELPETDENIKKFFKKITNLDNDEQRRKCASMSEIRRIMTLINYANDEKDFGMALEFGLDLFCTGHPFFHRSSQHLLSQAYQLLERDAFSRIITAHLDNRKKGNQLSVV